MWLWLHSKTLFLVWHVQPSIKIFGRWCICGNSCGFAENSNNGLIMQIAADAVWIFGKKKKSHISGVLNL